MEFRTMRRSELDAWSTHCQEVFQEPDPLYFKKHYDFDPDADESLVFLAMDGDTIAATVRVFKRRIWLHGVAVDMGGIGEVSTKPAYRRQGLAMTLVQHAIAQMEARNIPISILYGNQRIYFEAGWRNCPCRMTTVLAAELPLLGEGAVLRPFEDRDLAAVMGMYDLYASRLNGAVLRSEAYWKQWVLPQWRSPQVLEVDGQAIAYGCVRKGTGEQEGTAQIAELCAAPQGEAYLPALVRAACESAGCHHARFLTAFLPEVGGNVASLPNFYMARLNLPWQGLADSDALVSHIQDAGMCEVDFF